MDTIHLSFDPRHNFSENIRNLESSPWPKTRTSYPKNLLQNFVWIPVWNFVWIPVRNFMYIWNRIKYWPHTNKDPSLLTFTFGIIEAKAGYLNSFIIGNRGEVGNGEGEVNTRLHSPLGNVPPSSYTTMQFNITPLNTSRSSFFD